MNCIAAEQKCLYFSHETWHQFTFSSNVIYCYVSILEGFVSCVGNLNNTCAEGFWILQMLKFLVFFSDQRKISSASNQSQSPRIDIDIGAAFKFWQKTFKVAELLSADIIRKFESNFKIRVFCDQPRIFHE